MKMVRRLLREALEKINRIRHAKAVLNKARIKNTFFTRERKMTFPEILLLILGKINTSTQTALNRYLKTYSERAQRMSQQAFSKARSHFDHTPFETMFREEIEEQYGGSYYQEQWKGFHIFAIDGSDIALPDVPELKKTFGGSGRGAGSPTAKASVLYDVLNDLVFDASLDRAGSSERELAIKHIERYRRICPENKAIMVFDRGYPSKELIKALESASVNFLMRVREKWNCAVDEAGGRDRIIRLEGTGKLRVIRCGIKEGAEEVLITNLYNLPYRVFKRLYHMRWPAETKYDALKNKLALENFSGYTENVILQDFWATLALCNMCATARNEANERVRKERKGIKTKYEYVPNVNQVVGSLKDILIRFIVSPSEKEKDELLKRMSDEILHALVPVRPNRSVPRPANPRKSKFHHNRKLNG
jgi:hypothetical protein